MTDRLRVGLLQAGYVHPDVAATEGDYPQLFADLLGPQELDLTVVDVQRQGVPASVDEQDAWVISGSASSAYEDLDWIRDLEGFARDLMAAEAPLVGICFGHQVLAQAMGGRVEKAPVGWGVGVHTYDLIDGGPDWTGGRPEPVRMVASHQDQVTALPDGAVRYLTSDFCPEAGYTLGTNAMTMQAHPEFTPDLSAALLKVRRDLIGADTCDTAATTLAEGADSAAVAGWIGTFLRSRTAGGTPTPGS
jgi:GMP synthase-like glutamine amidotransferase